ncbi:MAG: YccF domain-containing protein [Oscillospiraceae bacterium]|nr:YccF domain-containing protein [Oscillospiraceae bacterium]
MRILGNIIWIICGGLLSALTWVFFGLIWCITIVGIPIGKQCFKLSSISPNPFGKEIEYADNGSVSFLMNVLWFLFGGAEMALGNALLGVLLCITIIGIPFGKQFFKIAGLSLIPFGAKVERVHIA